MENPVAVQKRNGKYLWFAILGLGFNPETEISTLAIKTSTKHINLGPAMFDKPNKDAFYIVAHFLLERLNPTRFNELYRHCWPVLDHKADAEFRKVTCTWLREIMDETASAGSKVQASLFLSPGGPKFVTLMLHLTYHVMVQEMKTFNTDGTWVPEAAALPASSVDMAVKRLKLIRSRFLKMAVDQDRFLQEYQRRAQALVKSVREIQADGAKYDELLKQYSDDTVQDQASLVEKARKVRALWSTIEGIVSSTQEAQDSMQCVLKGDVDQYTLDWSEKPLKISPSLLERIQQLPQQLTSGNLYEAGQLNLLSVLELTNHALQLLKEEKSRVFHCPQTLLVPEQLQEKCQQMSRMLQDLHLIRQRISKEEAPQVKKVIRELEQEWDRKWCDVLQNTPLTAFLNEDPALGFLSPMAPLSFEPAPDSSYRSGIFAQYPAKLLDKSMEKLTQEPVAEFPVTKSKSCLDLDENKMAAVSAEAVSRANTSLDWLFDRTSPVGTAPAPTPKVAAKSSAMSNVSKVTPLRSRTEIIALECDNLADQFADAVITSGATPGCAKGLDLEDLLCTVHGDPFSTRKQLPRTPESLIMEVKSSWRKAIEEDKAERICSTKYDDSLTGRLTPLGNASYGFQSPFAPVPTKHKWTPPTADMPSVCQQGALMKSNLGWDTFNTETDSPSGTGSSAVQFSLDHETLPEMQSCDSLLSLDDVDVSKEELSPHLQSGLKRTTTTQRACAEDLFASQINVPGCLLSPEIPTLNSDWATAKVKSEKTADQTFCLDFDTLDIPTTPTQEFILPKLIKFSPLDDMKC
ncbi:HAUS augmin-like complex subunit 6 [Eucyclogobius newberryi]|uniref:HAUS augmin-like complex subunit 6 n=1 Tax=Eucyclogobius newberryi TaxID=166745 RepID=UPI003B5BD8FA